MAQNSPTRPPNRKRKKNSALFTPLAFLLVCAALIFGMSVFFRVSKIEIIGAGGYAQEEILSASGIEKGDNLIFIDRSGAATRIKSRLPYIDTVVVHRTLPSTVTIEITESQALAYIAVEGELWVLDRKCKALSKTTSSETDDLIQVVGLTVDKPVIGEAMTGQDAEASKLEFLSVVLRELSIRGMQSRIETIDMTNPANPCFDYDGRFTVHLGKNEDVDYKLDRLLSVVAQLGAGDIGTLDLSIDDRVHYTQG